MRGFDFDPSRRGACVDKIERVNELRKMFHPKTDLPAGFFRARLHADLYREVDVIVVGPGHDSHPGALSMDGPPEIVAVKAGGIIFV